MIENDTIFIFIHLFQLNRSQTADEILNQVVAQQQLPGDNWALVEVICNEELGKVLTS